MYDLMIAKGWPPEKIVVGLVTNPANGGGFVPWSPLSDVLTVLRGQYGKFGGVMGWEYFNSLPGGKERPWEWARQMSTLLRGHLFAQDTQVKLAAKMDTADVDPDTPGGKEVEVPA
ncbi:hypothetical protein NLJ89_g6334 [Agrocybe chaxingu]|uniref:Chitinase n=1 Tax=Agrocybe chaxingu TaxID=84603 RepID=A0A9W8JZD6_9AGAR|nr:hypothetical protein NLJ89_g6334 [Agrocybe chaxingu]